MSVRRYRQFAIVTTVGVGLLTVAGGVVRLTDSGLGCDDWPACNDTSFIDVSSTHAAIEQINRLFSGVIGIPTLLLAIAGFLVRDRPGLRWPAVGVLVTVFANAVVGGFAVRGDLHPALVQSHFLLAMASLTFGTIAVRRSRPSPDEPAAPIIPPSQRSLALGLAAFTLAALVTGTIVTGTGPHAGDEEARRFGVDISNVARTHSVTVLLAVGLGGVLAIAIQRSGAAASRRGSIVSTWLFVGLLQGALGYAQYFNGVPEVLVAVHIAGATVLWAVTLALVMAHLPALGGDPHPAPDGDEPRVYGSSAVAV